MGSPFAMKRGRSGIHGVSLALHSSSSAGQDIPSAASLKEKAVKCGMLKKLSGKGILTAGTWRERFCLLVKSRLYYFESEDSLGTEKSAGFVNLDYFDCVSEAAPTRVSRKASNVFVIGALDRGFFDSHSGRHYFAAQNATEMTDWVTAVKSAMQKIRTKEKRSSHGQSRDKSPSYNVFKTQMKESGSKAQKTTKGDEGSEELTSTLPRSSGRLDCAVTKSRVRGPTGRRLPRKSHVPSAAPVKRTVRAVIEKTVAAEDSSPGLDGSDGGNGELNSAGNDSDERAEDSGGGGRREPSVAGEVNGDGGSEGTEEDNKAEDEVEPSTRLSSLDKESASQLSGDESESEELTSHDNNASFRTNFDQAWFLTVPGEESRSISPGGESTSDYFSMNLAGSRSLSVTPNSETSQAQLKGARAKLTCVIL